MTDTPLDRFVAEKSDGRSWYAYQPRDTRDERVVANMRAEGDMQRVRRRPAIDFGGNEVQAY